jgi:hypothetical protein
MPTINIEDAARYFRTEQQRIRLDLRRAAAAAIQSGFEYAKRESSGPFSLSALAAMDHPYAKRHGSPMLDPGRINIQTGDFYRGWNNSKPMAGDAIILGRIYNLDRVADFLKYGTRFMFARPIEQRVETFLETAAYANVRQVAGNFERRN